MSTTDRTVQTREILLATRRLYEAMFRFDAFAAAELGIHVTDLRCVNALEGGPLTAGEIGVRLSLTSGSVTALINRLVRAGLVERIFDADDRRRAQIALLPGFRITADRIYSRLGRAIEMEVARLDPPTRASAVPVIDGLTSGFARSPTEG